MPDTPPRATLSVAIITFNEEENIGRTLASVKDIADEIIVVDSGSTDRTVEIAKEFWPKIFIEPWKGFAAQKNLALEKCSGDWVLSLDADEELPMDTRGAIRDVMLKPVPNVRAWSFSRRNMFLGRWIRRGGFYPDAKIRLIKRGEGRFQDRAVHEDIELRDAFDCCESLDELGDLIHHQYPTLTSYIEHMNRYSSLGAQMVVDKRRRVGFSILNIVVRPVATFIYNYFFRLGFLDGKEGLLLHLYHSVYVSWKYAKAWELSRKNTKQ